MNACDCASTNASAYTSAYASTDACTNTSAYAGVAASTDGILRY